jgi:acetyl esterase
MNNRFGLHEDYRGIPSHEVAFSSLFVEICNASIKYNRLIIGEKSDSPVSCFEHEVTGFDGEVFNVKVFRPIGVMGEIPAVIYYHGGAFCFTYTASHLLRCEQYSIGANCIVVFVDYRLAPRNPFPYGFNDCYATLQWAIGCSKALGIDSSRIAVMGDDAGGALAAAVSLRVIDEGVELCAQLLTCPLLDSDCKTASAVWYRNTPLWNASSNRRMWRIYLKNFGSEAPIYASPSHSRRLFGLPKAYIETAEFDPARDEGIAYAGRLAAHNVPVELHNTKGTIHGFEFTSRSSEGVIAVQRRIEFIKNAFQS